MARCGVGRCKCPSFKPQKWNDSKCHCCFHWADQHIGLEEYSEEAPLNIITEVTEARLSTSSVSRLSTSSVSRPSSSSVISRLSSASLNDAFSITPTLTTGAAAESNVDVSAFSRPVLSSPSASLEANTAAKPARPKRAGKGDSAQTNKHEGGPTEESATEKPNKPVRTARVVKTDDKKENEDASPKENGDNNVRRISASCTPSTTATASSTSTSASSASSAAAASAPTAATTAVVANSSTTAAAVAPAAATNTNIANSASTTTSLKLGVSTSFYASPNLSSPSSPKSKQTQSFPPFSPSLPSLEDDESDEEIGPKSSSPPMLRRIETLQSLTSKLSQPFTVLKARRAGLKHTRVLAIDDKAFTLKICDQQLNLRSEIPLNKVTVRASMEDERKIMLAFKDRSRVYELSFEDVASCRLFCINYDTVMFKYEQQQQQAKGGGGGEGEDAGKKKPVLKKTLSEFKEGDVLKDVSEHLEYKITKKNKYRQKQQRILVIKPNCVVLLDSLRKFIKELPFDKIHSVDITVSGAENGSSSSSSSNSKQDMFEAFLVFHREAAQRPFQIYFADVFDRSHFAQSLKSAHRKLILMDESDESGVRFVAIKKPLSAVSEMRGGKKRILEVLPALSTLRSFDRIKQFKDTPFSKIKTIEPCSQNNCRIFLTKHTSQRSFDFPDHLSRARFLALATFLLDSVRGEPPGKRISIFTGSWNVGGCAPPSSSSSSSESSSSSNNNGSSSNSSSSGSPSISLDQFLKAPFSYDMYAIAMQECNKREEWVLEFQRHIGGHERDFLSLDEKERESRAAYETVGSVKLWEISLVLFVKKELMYKITCRETGTVACGVGDVLGNKGGAALSIRYEDTSLVFVTSHLAARAERLKERRENFLKIVTGLRFGNKKYDILHSSDHLFWFGDLNYRVEMGFQDAIACSERRQFDKLVNVDQLKREMSKQSNLCGVVFPGFEEGDIKFAPTYRWEKQHNVFSNKREQPPSYTDRVLYHTSQGSCLLLDNYSSAPDLLGSDHRPVYAVFSVVPRSFQWGGYNELRCPRMDITLSEMKLTSTDFDADTCLQFVVSAPFLLEDIVSEDVIGCLPDLADISTSRLCIWEWDASTFFRAFLEPHHLPLVYLLITIRERNSEICYGSIPLHMSSFFDSSFTVPLTKDGVYFGDLNGQFTVHADEKVPKKIKTP